jgi:Flp pilus assembly secretin CpaC
MEVIVKRRITASAAIVAFGLAISPARAEANVEAVRPSITLELGGGSTVMLERPFESVLIGHPDIVEVHTQSDRSVLLEPLNSGTTNLVFIDGLGMVIANLTVLVRDARPI